MSIRDKRPPRMIQNVFVLLLLAVFAVVVVLMLVKVLPSQTARYLIIAILGAAFAINGISGYRQSKWAGFFLMVFGTLLCLGNLFMLGQ